MAHLVELHQCERVYGDQVKTWALRSTNLALDPGELVVILGPSGSGKTTLLNLIGGLDGPTGGRVLVNGVAINHLSPERLTAYRRESLGFIFQFYNLITSLTAWENVALTADLVGRRDQVDRVLEAVGLTHRAHAFPGQMSGGEQQRVAIARALVKGPQLLLCDEPTGALDYETGKAVLGLLQETARSEGRTVLIVTHNSALAAMASRVLRMKDGEIHSDQRQPRPIAAAELVW